MISKGEKFGSKQGKYGSKASGFDKDGETKQVIKANDHNKMNEVANMERNKGDDGFRGEAKLTLDGSKHPSKCK